MGLLDVECVLRVSPLESSISNVLELFEYLGNTVNNTLSVLPRAALLFHVVFTYCGGIQRKRFSRRC